MEKCRKHCFTGVLFALMLLSACAPAETGAAAPEDIRKETDCTNPDSGDVIPGIVEEPDADSESAEPILTPVYLLDAFDEQLPALKEVYAEHFYVGAAVDPYALIEGTEYYETVSKHYNVLTAQGSMKQNVINPADTGNFRFNGMDQLLDFAQKQDALVRGHTLIWHDSVQDFWFWHEDGLLAGPEELLARMETYITAVVEHGKGRVAVWDVVNEPMSDLNGLRMEDEGSYYASIIGDLDNDGNAWDYIEKAFIYAHAADPDAVLVINEYGLESNPRKLDAFCVMLEDLLKKGIPVGGVGIQLHAKYSTPYASEVSRCIERLAEFQAYNADFTVQITELDISVFESGDQRTRREMDVQVQKKLAQRYQELFDVFVEQAEKGNLDMVVTWGVYDGSTWLDFYPVAGRRDAPLLFDRQWKVKPAFWALVSPENLTDVLDEYALLHG